MLENERGREEKSFHSCLLAIWYVHDNNMAAHGFTPVQLQSLTADLNSEGASFLCGQDSSL